MAYRPEARASDSSCARAPVRKPPPGFFAEAKFRAATRCPLLANSRATSSVDAFTTSIFVRRSAKAGTGAARPRQLERRSGLRFQRGRRLGIRLTAQEVR